MDLSLLKDKTVVFVFGNLELGGAERQGFLLAQYLHQQGCANVEIWGLSKEPGTLSKMCEDASIPWRALRFSWRTRYRPASLLNLVYHLRKANADVVIPYTAVPNVACGLTWRVTTAKMCIWNQEDEGLLLSKSIIHRLAVKLTPFFVSNSTGGMEFLKRTYRVPEERTEVIHNGVYLAPPRHDRQNWRIKIGVPDDALVACMVANVHPFKDHITLLKAWKQVVQMSAGPAPVLLLAGRIDAGGDALLQLVADLGIANYVQFLGKVDDVSGLLLSVDLCIHSSISEGLPNSVLEAMSCGVPVVGTDIPGIREAVGPNGAPFLVPVKDEVSLANRIKDVLGNPATRAELAQVQKKRIEKEFTLRHMCESTAAFIMESLT